MKKITIIAALLGSAYFANAQVGIGTPAPATSAMLDITATNKGVLIPRVELTSLDQFSPVTGTEVNSLLVYATGVKLPENTLLNVPAGFYYWNVNKWERIVSQTDLTNAIENANAELEDIINLLQTAYPSNNLDGSTTTGSALGGGMVYTPASGTQGEAGYVPAKIEYVYFDGTQYVKQDMTTVLNDIITPETGNVIYNPTNNVFQYWDGDSYETITLTDLVQANETKTKIVTIGNKQYYVSESYTGAADPTLGTEAGVFLIDVVGGVVNNFNEIAGSQVTVNGQTYPTLTQYIETISQNNLADGVTKIVITEGQASFQTWNNTTNTWESVSNASFSTIVKANESKTTVLEFPADSGKFYYISEAAIQENNGIVPTSPFTDANNQTLINGVVYIDVPASVSTNFESILDQTTTIEIPGQTNQYYTVEQVIQNLIEEYSDANLPGTMVYTPGTNLTEASFTYTLANGTQSPAVTFSTIVKANQSLTDIATTTPSANVINYVYTAEPNLDGTARVFTIDLTQDLINQITYNGDVKNAITNVMGGGVYYNGTGSALMVGTVSIPAGSLYTKDSNGNGVLIDLGSIVVSEVIENFNTIVNSQVTVNTIQYDSVEEYIQYIAETSDANVGFTTTEITAANNPGGTLIPANSFYYINDAGVKVIIDLEDLVLANESKTGFVTGTNTDGNTFIYYIGEEYLAQNDFPTEAIANGWANGATLPTTVTLLDIPQAVSTNFETILDQTTTIEIPGQTNQYYTVEQVIQNIANSNGTNVGYTTVSILENTSTGQAPIPAGSLYYINDNGIKIEIPMGTGVTVQQIINALTDVSTTQDQINTIKTELGDVLIANTSVITGDTYKGKAVRKGIFSTTITENRATTTGVTLDVAASEIISITVKYNGGLVANVTDLTVSGTAVGFNIGTGKMYQVLGSSNITAEVIVEFAVQ